MLNFILSNNAAFTKSLAKYSINTPLRVAHFLGQLAHESGNFTKNIEDISYTKAQSNYQNHRYLGNKLPGDGYRFRGRGLIQLTGRANYEAYTKYSGNDIVNNPEKARELWVSIDVACWFFSIYKKLNRFADSDDIYNITQKINGGQNGASDRANKVAYFKSVDILTELKKKIKISNPFVRINKYGLWNSFLQGIKN